MKDKEIMEILNESDAENMIYHFLEYNMDFGKIAVKVVISMN